MGTAYNGCDLSNFYFAYRVSGYSPLLVGELIVSLTRERKILLRRKIPLRQEDDEQASDCVKTQFHDNYPST
ncbi:hypothetical protein KKE26_08395 [bacterium]|nr:hypothetical protein [bacterium]